MDESTLAAFERVKRAIERHGPTLAAIPGVLAVRPGYAARAGEMAEPAVIVLVLRKRPSDCLAPDDVLPEHLEGVPVDVQQATVQEQRSLGIDPGRIFAWIESRAAGSGIVDRHMPSERECVAEAAIESASVEYPMPDFSLHDVDEVMDVTVHSSPDNGWKELKDFLSGACKHLSATIYEFQAEYVLDAMLEVLGEAGTLDFVMQHFAVRDRWDNLEAHQRLTESLGRRLSFAWAPVVRSNATTRGWFPTAYHEKVIVKDGVSLWLSSGNWKASGQPLEDPFAPPPAFDEASFMRSKNREWHVTAHAPALAAQFERFIRHDLDTALPVQRVPAAEMPAVELPDVLVPLDAAEPEVEVRWFPTLTIQQERLHVTPLLSPDDFVERITDLVATAQSRLYIQNQYLKPTNAPRWKRLNELVRDFSLRGDADFKVIIRDTDFWQSLEMMKAFGIERSSVKVLAGSHTKGIIVDDRAVVIGSHNWSGQGFMANRDASLVFRDARIVKHFEALFLYDYGRARVPRRAEPDMEPRFVTASDVVPAGMRRVRWADYFDD